MASRSPHLRLVGCSLVFAMLVALRGVAHADVTDDRRALVMLRVLAYDKQLASRIGDSVRIVVVSAKGDDAEPARWAQAFAKAAKLKVDGRPVVLSLHTFESADALDRVMRDLHPAAIVACDGLVRRISTADLAKLSRAHHVLTFTTREAEVVRGLGVGVVPGSERDEIVVNLYAIAAEGVRFDAGLLQLARTVKGEP